VHTVNEHVECHHHAIGEFRCVVTHTGHHFTAHAHAASNSLNQFALVGHDSTVPPPPLRLGYSPPPMIDDTTVRHVARLARLRLDDAEEQVMREELSGILEHIDAIRAMDLDGVPPTTHVIELENVLRADEPRQGLSQEDALREARAVVDGSFEVPRMD
jgi:aspartyl-tRNA(Asn)/glutamyl-tRNA(Gln) amidotransferase subunit C